ncbi:acyl- oxidase [Moniliophthora roreri MCA 2997]|uniref:Acyl-oxidase n=1 Tax=Moniliophthora roreri (strain MCA 2997) TaxID=1381753 RepID=V2X1V2_MONRO|nr:acyl- oxidase [Moniliophthora roreri MCA 2997]KAI3608065.1 acyl-oxidase [Moniliophthora roreri]
MSRITSQLARSPLWRIRTEQLSFEERVSLSYERCKSVVNAYQLTADDILNLSPKYWAFHGDPIHIMDGSVGSLLAIHFNLCLGTLATYASKRNDLTTLLEKMLQFEIVGQFCLTEVGHGLDVINMETTATMLSSGDFMLNSPVKEAAKYMPPTAPCGIPMIAVVFARLLVGGEDRGVKPFMVHLNDGHRMNSNINCKVLPPRGGSSPVKHAITYFKQVCLPSSALLGTPERGKDMRASFFRSIHRVFSGTLSMGAVGISAMRISSYIAGRYSSRRKVIDSSTGRPRAIINFSTQYIPVLTSIAQTLVLEAFSEIAHLLFVEAKRDMYRQHFIATVFKATTLQFALSIPVVLGDRCGVQGLSKVNQISVLHADMRGAAIAEGDVLVTSIRFAGEVVLGRIQPPPPTDPTSVLYRHEQALITELQQLLKSHSNHRNPEFERRMLPQCQALMVAIGLRLAYESALAANVDRRILDLFVASVMKLDSAWYSESVGIARRDQQRMEVDCATALLPELESLLARLDVQDYITAPIVSDQSWDAFVDSLQTLPVGHAEQGQSWISSRL